MPTSAPLVSIITPVYNGGKYLTECIDSVLSQRYTNWEYTIVNNCSTDNTLEIAERFRSQDSRVKIVDNKHFVGVIENHNIAFRQISGAGAYCKVVSADDWLYPECIDRMVEYLEANPSAGIVQAYTITDTAIRSFGVPVGTPLLSGREAGRLFLLGKLDFAAPSAALYRAELVRSMTPFYPGTGVTADAAACLECVEHCDLGVIHQILSFERVHYEQLTAKVRELSSHLLDCIELLKHYGSRFLTEDELALRLDSVIRSHYDDLAIGLLHFRGSEFRQHHKQRMAGLGLSFCGWQLFRALAAKMLDLLMNPKRTLTKVLRSRGAVL